MKNLIRIVLIGLLPLCVLSCKTSKQAKKDTNTINMGFHIDNVLADRPQTLLFAPVTANSSFVSISASGDSSMFRMLFIDKTLGVKSVAGYKVDTKYFSQSSTCAIKDNNDNIWVGGYMQKYDTTYSKPFLVKLDKDGNVLQAQYFPIYHNVFYQDYYRGCTLKMLANGDLLYIISSNFELQLMELHPNGEVVWAKKYEHGGEQVYQPYNGQVIIDAAGNFTFVVNGTGLFKTDPQGNIIYQRAIIISELTKLIALKTGELLLTGNDYTVGQIPSVFKVNAADGTVTAAKQMTDVTDFNLNDTFQDMQEVNGQIRFVHFSATQYNTITMNENDLSILKIQRTLSDHGGFGFSTRLFFDVPNNAIYHLLDLAGPYSEGIQFLKTDLVGKSCHVDAGSAVTIPFEDLAARQSTMDFTATAPDMIPVAIPFNLVKTVVSKVVTHDGCNE